MDTEERIRALEQRQAEINLLIEKLIAIAKISPKGRVLLTVLGVKP